MVGKPILVLSFGLVQAEEQVIFDFDVTCVSESTMVGLTACGGGGVGVGTRACCVAADKMDSNFSIRSIRSIFPLAKISSTICIDSANETGPLPKYPIFEEKLREKMQKTYRLHSGNLWTLVCLLRQAIRVVVGIDLTRGRQGYARSR